MLVKYGQFNPVSSMSDLQTSVTIKAINQASEPMQKVAADMKALSQEMQKASSDKGIAQSLGNIGKGAGDASKGLTGMKGVMGDVAGNLLPFSIGTAGLAAAIVALGKVSLDAAREVQEVGIRAKSVFGADFPQMDAAAQQLEVSLRRDKEELLGMASSFGAMARGAGVAKDAANDLSIEMTKAAVAFGKITSKSDAQAFDIFRQGLSGMGRGLKEYGIFVDDANMKTFAYTKGIKMNYEEMNEAGKTMLRSMLIQEKVAEMQGNLGGETSTLTDAWKEFKAAIDPVLTALGTVILVPITEFLEAMAGGVRTAVNLLRLLGAAAKDTAADIYNMGLSVAQFFGIASEAQKLSTDNVSDEIDRMSSEFKEANMSMQTDLQSTQKEHQNLVDEINNNTKAYKAYGGGAGGAAKDTEKLKDAMKELGKGFDDVSKDISRKMRDLEIRHNEAVDSMNQKQRELYERLQEIRQAAADTSRALTDMTNDFNEAMGSLNVEREDNVVSQLQKVKDLSDELQRSRVTNDGFFNGMLQNVLGGLSDPTSGKVNYRDVQSFNLTTDQEEMVNLTLSLHREQQALKDYLVENLNLSDKLKDSLRVGSTDFMDKASEFVKQSAGGGVARASQSDFTKAMAELRKRAQDEQERFDRGVEGNKRDQEKNTKAENKVKEEIADLEKKRKTVEFAYRLERAELGATQVALGAFHNDYQAKMVNIDNVTKITVDNVRRQFELLRQALQQAQQDAAAAAASTSRAGSRGRARFADGGIVQQQAGGHEVIIGEGLYNEAVVPLPDGRTIPVRIEGGGVGTGTKIEVNLGGVTIRSDMDLNTVVRKITTSIDNQLLKSR